MNTTETLNASTRLLGVAMRCTMELEVALRDCGVHYRDHYMQAPQARTHAMKIVKDTIRKRAEIADLIRELYQI